VTWNRSIEPIRSDGNEQLLDVPRQVAAIEEVELAQPEPKREAPRVVARVGLHVGGGLGAERVGRTARRVDHLAARRQNNDLDLPLEQDRVAGAECLALALAFADVRNTERVGRPRPVGIEGPVIVGCLRVGQSAVPVLADRQPFGQPLDSAEVVGVPVRRHHVVEVVEPGDIFEDLLDPLGVPVLEPAPA